MTMNDGNCKTYDAKGCTIILDGIIVMDFADGEFIQVTGMTENFEPVSGADGSENRNNKNITGVDVSIIISQTSSTNDLLSAKHAVDKLNNSGKGAFLFKDINGASIVSSGQAYIKGYADMSNGNALATRTWMIRCPQAIVFVGGNL
jgi:hypothetical protein